MFGVPAKKEPESQLGKAIDRAMAELGLIQDELKKRLRVSQSTISRWRQGEIPLDRVGQLESILERQHGQLLIEGGYVTITPGAEQAIMADPLIEDRHRAALLETYRAFASKSGAGGGSATAST